MWPGDLREHAGSVVPPSLRPCPKAWVHHGGREASWAPGMSGCGFPRLHQDPVSSQTAGQSQRHPEMASNHTLPTQPDLGGGCPEWPISPEGSQGCPSLSRAWVWWCSRACLGPPFPHMLPTPSAGGGQQSGPVGARGLPSSAASLLPVDTLVWGWPLDSWHLHPAPPSMVLQS